MGARYGSVTTCVVLLVLSARAGSLGVDVDTAAPASPSSAPSLSLHVTTARKLPVSNVAGVVPDGSDLDVLRASSFPGDPSGAGWEVDRVDPSTGRVLRRARGDADPVSMLKAFGSLWIETSPGAKPGGLGSGVDRLAMSTLVHQSRMNLEDLVSVGATARRLWLLTDRRIEAIDPATGSVSGSRSIPSLVESLATTSDRVIVGYQPFDAGSPDRTAITDVSWIDASTLTMLSTVAVAHTSSAAGAAEDADALAAVDDSTIYVGLESTKSGESLVRVHGTHVQRVARGVGFQVTTSPLGDVWAAGLTRQHDGPVTSVICHLTADASASTCRSGFPALRSMSVVGSELYAGTSHLLLVLQHTD